MEWYIDVSVVPFATCYPFLVLGFIIIKNKWQQYLIDIGKVPWSICALLSPSLNVFAWSLDIDLQSCCKIL